jgi:hypothetical protein
MLSTGREYESSNGGYGDMPHPQNRTLQQSSSDGIFHVEPTLPWMVRAFFLFDSGAGMNESAREIYKLQISWRIISIPNETLVVRPPNQCYRVCHALSSLNI